MASNKGFRSLGDQLREAVRDKFGESYYLDEFTDDQAILSRASKTDEVRPGPGGQKQFSVAYAVDGDKVSFSGKPTPVERVTRYEPVSGRSLPTDLIKHLSNQDGVVGSMAKKTLRHREKTEK